MNNIERVEIKIDNIHKDESNIKGVFKGELDDLTIELDTRLSNNYTLTVRIYKDELITQNALKLNIYVINNKGKKIDNFLILCKNETELYKLFNIELNDNNKTKNIYVQIVKYKHLNEEYIMRSKYMFNKRHSLDSNDYLYDLLTYSDFVNKYDLYHFCCGAILNNNCVKHISFAQNTLNKFYYSGYNFYEDISLNEEKVLERLKAIINYAKAEILPDNLMSLLVEYVELLCLITVNNITYDYRSMPDKEATGELLKDIYAKILKSLKK